MSKRLKSKVLTRRMNREGNGSGNRQGYRSYDEIAAEMKRRHNITLSRARVYQLLMRAEWKLREGLRRELE